MSDLSPVLPLFISTMSARYSAAYTCRSNSSFVESASLTWPVANTAFYVPMFIPFHYPVRRVWWCNGSSVTSTNMDFGVFTASGAKIYSTGSTAQSGASTQQYVSPTAFVLAPGEYYFALACSSTTANRGGQGTTGGTATARALCGVLQEASALPLPADMTPVTVANACYPLCGITRTASGF